MLSGPLSIHQCLHLPPPLECFYGEAEVMGRGSARVSDEVMRRVFPPESWRVCTGPAHTMVLADTLGYHRGGKPLEGRRILVTFTYTSGASIVKRPIWLRDEPSWISRRIQRAAIKLLRRRV